MVVSIHEKVCVFNQNGEIRCCSLIGYQECNLKIQSHLVKKSFYFNFFFYIIWLRYEFSTLAATRAFCTGQQMFKLFTVKRGANERKSEIHSTSKTFRIAFTACTLFRSTPYLVISFVWVGWGEEKLFYRFTHRIDKLIFLKISWGKSFNWLFSKFLPTNNHN